MKLAPRRAGSSFVVVAVAALSFTLAACGQKKPPEPPPPVEPVASAEVTPPPPPPPPKTLFERLGGKEGLTALVKTLMENVQADKRINKHFAKTKGDRLEKFKARLVEQLCQITGGPCEYKGKDMKAAHKGMGITEGGWDAFIEALTAAMQEKQVGQDEQGEVLVALGKFKEEIVEKKAAKK